MPIFQDETSLYVISAVVVVSCILGAVVFYQLSRFYRKLSLKRKFSRGLHAESKARRYLEKHGYTVLEEQPRRDALLRVDGDPVNFHVRADFLVEKDGESAIVEVKTGQTAAKPSSMHTRRQLFEYSHLYDVDKLLFFDGETESLKVIEFEHRQVTSDNAPERRKVFLYGVLCGSLLMLLVAIAVALLVFGHLFADH